MNINPSPRTQITDERFYTPRAQVSTGRSTVSSITFGTPRTARSSDGLDCYESMSLNGSEYGTPRNHDNSSNMYWEHPRTNTTSSSSSIQRRPSTTTGASVGYYSNQHGGYTSNSNQSYYNGSSENKTNLNPRRSNIVRNHNHNYSHSMIPPQYPSKIARREQEVEVEIECKTNEEPYEMYYNPEGDDVESQSARSGYGGHDTTAARSVQRAVDAPSSSLGYDYNEQDLGNIFSYARHGRVEEVDNLLLRGIPVDTRDDNGNTILLVACQNGNKRLVKLALRYGADINLCNFKGNTALHFCFRYGYAKTLGTYLKCKGADDGIRNLNGETCEDLGGTEC